ncbi:MAG: phage antirepressor KilAC domain-containing protein [bacterium]
MNELKIFESEDFGSIRTIQGEKGKILFCGSDVAKALGYVTPRKAVSMHCKQGMVQNGPHPQSPTKQIEMTFIPEGDVYRLIIKSKLPQAEKFEAWVFEEVLPSIREYGGYIANQENLSDEDIFAKAILIAQRVINKQNTKISQLQSKADFFDAVTESEDTFDMLTVAKILNFEGVGRTTLFAILRNEKILMKDNQPYQKYIDRGWFRVIESRFVKRDGDVSVNTKTVVYQKGVDGILKLMNKLKGVEVYEEEN